MNLVDALKKGRPFRRPGTDWFRNAADFIKQARVADDFHGFPWHDELVREDWEVHEPAVSITRSQFMAVVAAHDEFSKHAYKGDVQDLARALGLGE